MEKNAYFRTPGQAIGTGPVQDRGLQRRPVDGARAATTTTGAARRTSTRSSAASSRTPPPRCIAFEAGEVDYTYVTADEVERAATITTGTVLPGPSGVDLDIVLNPLKNKDFADKRVRQAFLYAIDRKSILQNIYHIPEPTLLNCLYNDPALNPPDVHTYDYDPEKAKALLPKPASTPPAGASSSSTPTTATRARSTR